MVIPRYSLHKHVSFNFIQLTSNRILKEQTERFFFFPSWCKIQLQLNSVLTVQGIKDQAISRNSPKDAFQFLALVLTDPSFSFKFLY